MTTTITQGATTITPQLVTGYTTARSTNNIFHEIIGRADPDVTLRPASLRTGTLSLFFLSASAAWAASTAHAVAAKFTLTDSDIPQINMVYVVAGDISSALQDGVTRWLVTVDYREVAS